MAASTRSPQDIGNSVARAFDQVLRTVNVDLRMPMLAVLVELVAEAIEDDRKANTKS